MGGRGGEAGKGMQIPGGIDPQLPPRAKGQLFLSAETENEAVIWIILSGMAVNLPLHI